MIYLIITTSIKSKYNTYDLTDRINNYKKNIIIITKKY